MALEVRFKKEFESDLKKLIEYLVSEWGTKVTESFLQKLWARVERLSNMPFLGRPSSKVKNVRSILITKHNRLYYRVTNKYLVILMLFDTRFNPQKNRY